VAVTADDVRAALDALGGTADEVAETLRAKGVKGVPGSACDCVLAVYLRDTFGGVPFEVYPHDESVTCGNGFWGLPTAAIECALNFDELRYPDLVAEAR